MKKRNGLLMAVVLMLLTTGYSFAQVSFSGKVIDSSTHEPIAGASILLEGTSKQGTYSNAQGAFSLSHLRQGSYRMHISYLGYQTTVQDMHMEHPVTGYVISLKNVGLFVRPVEISALRAGENAPFTQTTIRAADIQELNLGQDLPYLLNLQPSVVTTSDAGAGVGYTGLWIRGTDASRINVTFNGIPVNDAESSGAVWVDFSDIASSTGSIQIQRGVGTSTNGAGAFGATINLSTNEFHADPYGELMSAYGSFHTWKHEVKAGSGLLNNHFTVDARLSSITSDGYIDRASADLKSFYFSTAYFSKKTSLRFNIFSGKEKTYQAWNGVPEDTLKTHRTYNGLGQKADGTYYDNQTDNYYQTYYQLFLNQEMNAQWNFSVAAFLTQGKGYYEEYKPGELYGDYGLERPVIGRGTLEQTDLIRDRWLDNDYYGTIYSLNHTGKGLNWSFGGGWDRYDGKHDGNVVWAQYGIDKDYLYYHNTAHKTDFNLYWKGHHAITKQLSAFLDLQYRRVQYNIYGFDSNPGLEQYNNYNFFNPKVGFSYTINKHDRIYLSYAMANKEPNRDDFEAAKRETPKAERLGDVEAGYDRNGGFYHWHANLYYMHYKDQLVPTGKINDVGAYTRSNVPDSYRAGIELSGDVQFAQLFSFNANATFSRNRIKDFTEYIDNYDNGKQSMVHHGQTEIAFSPDIVGGAALSATPVSDLTLTVTGKYVGHRYLDNTTSRGRSLDAYFVNGLQAHYIWKPGWIKAVDIHCLVNNLFNIQYLTNGYTYSYISGGETLTENSYFPQAGTNFLVGLTLRF